MKHTLFVSLRACLLFWLMQATVSTLLAQNPGGVAGASLWLKASAGVSFSGSNLTGWIDQTGNNTFSVVGTPGFRFAAVNFNPAAVFNNLDDQNVLPANRLDGNTAITYVDGFAVYLYADDAPSFNFGTFLGSVGLPVAPAELGVGIFAATGRRSAYAANGIIGLNFHFTDPLTFNNFKYNVVNLDAALDVSPYGTGRANGLPQTILNGSNITFKDFPSIVFTPMIGGTTNPSVTPSQPGFRPMRGEVAEIILFPSSLSLTEKQRIESYLAIKYGISLGSNVVALDYVNAAGTTVWTANTTYKNDVFGIGRDDASGLNQAFSNSINTGSGDGTGQSGKANMVISGATSLDDGDFLMIGHDSGSLAEQETGLPTSISIPGVKRIGRQWRAQHTGDVGRVDVVVDLTGVIPNDRNIDDYALLVDEDGDGNFANAKVVAVTSIGSPVLTFTGVLIPNNAVLSVVTNAIGPILPVDLRSFDVVMNNCEANILWRTAHENKLRQYEIESTLADQIQWVSRAVVQPRGNGLSGDFSYKVKLTLDKSGPHQFRLKMVDDDGAVKYSRIALAGCQAGSAYLIYPNPATNRAQVVGTRAGQQLRLLDAQGRVMQQLAAQPGNTQVSLHLLPAGIYVLQGSTAAGWEDIGRVIRQ